MTPMIHSAIARAISALKTTLKREDERVYFVNNTGWFVGGVLILAITALLAAALSDIPGGGGVALVPIAGISVMLAMLGRWVIMAWSTVFSGAGSWFSNTFQALFMSFFLLLFVVGFGAGATSFLTDIPLFAVGAIVLGAVACAVFYHLLKAPTLLGAKVRDQIDGFRMFLNTAEKNRLEVLNPPQVTPEVFEKFLPYAIALDAENEWSKKFEAEAAAACQDVSRGGGYRPVWYSGSSFNGVGTSGVA